MATLYRMLGICALIDFFSMVFMSVGGFFIRTIDKIKHLLLAIKQEARSLVQTRGDLVGNMTETVASINQITAHIHSIKAQTNRQTASLKSTSSIMEQVVENIETLNSQIQKQADGVSQSSSAVEQMLPNIQSVTQTLVKNEENVTKLAQAAEVGRNSLQEVSVDIEEIARESAGPVEINRVDEIRKLAESSSEQSKTIRDVLNKIRESIDKITLSTNGVLLNCEAISEGVKP
ncbi:MAG: hypothetical protein LBF75_00665 [Treponema sp.]|nr:hypothetical protein [Treponema sp.]